MRVSPRVLRRAPGVRGPWSAARAWASCAFHQHFASSDPFGVDARLARPGLAVSACRVCALLFLSFAKRSVCPRRRGGGTGLACRRLTGSGRRAVHRTRTLVGGTPALGGHTSWRVGKGLASACGLRPAPAGRRVLAVSRVHGVSRRGNSACQPHVGVPSPAPPRPASPLRPRGLPRCSVLRPRSPPCLPGLSPGL